MRSFLTRLAASALLACGAGVVMAAPVELAGQQPYRGDVNGVQSDSSGTPPYSQSFTAPANSTLNEIVWWGYRRQDGGGPDNFTVDLGGVTQTGSLAVTVDTVTPNGPLLKYTLDIADQLLAANVLTIQNDGAFEWYWQGTTAQPFDDPLPFPVAFSLIGTLADPGVVPEPGTLALVSAAGLACVALRRRRAV